MIVTALKVHPRRPNRAQVYLDGRLALTLTRIEAARLQVGQALTEADLERLQARDNAEQAHERAVRLLATRPRSEAELRQRLQQAKVAPEVIAAVLERLKAAGLVDDQAFASAWVENRAAFRPRSRRALQAELRRKGVSRELVDQAVGTADDPEAAYALAARRARRLSALPWEEFRRKLGEFLVRRGFDYETAAAAVKRVWQETGQGRLESE